MSCLENWTFSGAGEPYVRIPLQQCPRQNLCSRQVILGSSPVFPLAKQHAVRPEVGCWAPTADDL